MKINQVQFLCHKHWSLYCKSKIKILISGYWLVDKQGNPVQEDLIPDTFTEEAPNLESENDSENGFLTESYSISDLFSAGKKWLWKLNNMNMWGYLLFIDCDKLDI